MRLAHRKREYIVVSVGGSLIVPDGIDTRFLQSFRELLLEKIEAGFSFFIIAGGGGTARAYQEAAESIRGGLDPDDVDWLGIHATRLNAHLLRSLFLEQAQARIVKNPTRRIQAKAPIVIGAGWKPGRSTDYCAVMAAKRLGATRIVNLSDVTHVFDQDPKQHADAKPLERVSWPDFRALIPGEWHPGLKAPFDPVAAKEAEASGLEVAVICGRDLPSFGDYIDGKPFAGTVVS